MLTFQCNIPQARQVIADFFPSVVDLRIEQAVIEAIRWQDGKLVRAADVPMPRWISKGVNEINPGEPGSIFRYGMDVHVYDKDGMLFIATSGDWLLWEKQETLLVFPDELFRQFYEPVQISADREPVALTWAQWEQTYCHAWNS